MAVSIELADFAPPKLTCLAQTIRTRYPGRRSITILIFSSHNAARYYEPVPADYAPAKNRAERNAQNFARWASELHGFYSLDVEKKEEFVELRPLGSDVGGSPYDTRINFPAAGNVSCQLQISGRCVLELSRISYPDVALKEAKSGSVLTTGTLSAGGKDRTSDRQGRRRQLDGDHRHSCRRGGR